jgi:hypothetical protein
MLLGGFEEYRRIVGQPQTPHLNTQFLKIASANHDCSSAPGKFLVCTELFASYKQFFSMFTVPSGARHLSPHVTSTFKRAWNISPLYS